MADVPNLYRMILQVSDLDKAVEFFSNLLDAKGRGIRGGRYYIDRGPVILVLLDPTGGGEPAKPNPEYIYFSVQGREQFHAQASSFRCLLKDTVHDEPADDIVKRPWGERSFYVIDPWENKLRFVDARSLLGSDDQF